MWAVGSWDTLFIWVAAWDLPSGYGLLGVVVGRLVICILLLFSVQLLCTSNKAQFTSLQSKGEATILECSSFASSCSRGRVPRPRKR